MADQKITQLTELTTPASGDTFAIVDDPAGSPVTKKITIDNLDLDLMDNSNSNFADLSANETVSGDWTISGSLDYGDSMPSTNVRFGVQLSSDYSPGNNNFNTVQFDTENYDDGNNFDNSTNYDFTAPVAGVYLFNCAARDINAADQDNLQILLLKNGATSIPVNSNGHSGSNAGAVSGSIQIKLAASDTIEFQAKNADTNPSWQSSGWTHFEGHLLST